MENIEKTFQNILLAEQEAQKIVNEAQDDAKKIIHEATIKVGTFRQETVEKLKNERTLDEQDFLKEKTKIYDDIQDNSKSQISALKKKFDNKKEKVAEQIVREILEIWQ